MIRHITWDEYLKSKGDIELLDEESFGRLFSLIVHERVRRDMAKKNPEEKHARGSFLTEFSCWMGTTRVWEQQSDYRVDRNR